MLSLWQIYGNTKIISQIKTIILCTPSAWLIIQLHQSTSKNVIFGAPSGQTAEVIADEQCPKVQCSVMLIF